MDVRLLHDRRQLKMGALDAHVPAVRMRMQSNLVNVDRDLAARVATVLGVAVPAASPCNGIKRYAPSPPLSMIARGNLKSIVGRKVAVLAADGDGLQAVKAMLVSRRGDGQGTLATFLAASARQTARQYRSTTLWSPCLRWCLTRYSSLAVRTVLQPWGIRRRGQLCAGGIPARQAAGRPR